MKEVNDAYDEIMHIRTSGNRGNVDYISIRQKVKAGRFAEAERELNAVSEAFRTAEWHYIKSVLLNRRGWVNDAMRELETACNMDPQNVEYQQAKEMFNNRMNSFGGGYNPYGSPRSARGMSMCDTCLGLVCADTCCECMGGDLISCC